MSSSEEKEKEKEEASENEMHEPPVREWTLMFYFASDNPLAPGIVSQLKAIKNAGYHPEVNVITHFDPQTEGTPTHIFDVNHIHKLKEKARAESEGAEPQPDIGFASNDPFVRNLLEDKLWVDELDRDKKPLREQIIAQVKKNLPDGTDYDPPRPTAFKRGVNSASGKTDKEPGPDQSLSDFLEFCRVHYPAKHYMLFILGHGVVVGNDMFLFDEHAERDSLTLKGLGHIMTIFARDIKRHNGRLELLSLHSCSMSSAEVAYELGGSVRYMLASQGPAFVGSWPYRSILIRIFNCLQKSKEDGKEGGMDDGNIEWMLNRIFSYCYYNSTDFLLAGYPFDLCLCDLDQVYDLGKPVKELSKQLVKGLKFPLLKEFILLAHWKSQSFWQESYTDLYDFCYCIRQSCADFKERSEKMTKELAAALRESEPDLHEASDDLHQACQDVMTALSQGPHSTDADREAREEEENEDDRRGGEAAGRLIVRAQNVGPAYQYSHGLSVFFPWSRPSEDSTIMREYEKYTFAETGWFGFLESYFKETERKTRKEEQNGKHAPTPEEEEVRRSALPQSAREREDRERLLEDMASFLFANAGVPGAEGTLSDDNRSKPGPGDPTGDVGTCGSIKNFPRDTRLRRERTQAAPERPFFKDFSSTAF